MGLIAALIATVLCTIVYVRMYRREIPEPIGKRQAALPVGLGVIAVMLTLPVFIGTGFAFRAITGGSVSDVVASPVLRSLISSLLLAGLTEELIKLAMFLIVLRVVKPKNVYEYGFLCAGVGFGFTGLEDVVYGLQNPVSSFFRVLFFAMHMMFGLLMGTQLGLAAYCKKQGNSDSGKHMVLALLLPVLWHTIFDASTTTNAGLQAKDRTTQIIGVVIALVVCAISIALQFVLLKRFKNDTKKYCSMSLVEDAVESIPNGQHFKHPGLDTPAQAQATAAEDKQAPLVPTAPEDKQAPLVPTAPSDPTPNRSVTRKAKMNKPKRDWRLHISTVRTALTAFVVLAFSFTYTMTRAWGERMDQLAAVSSSDIFKTMDLETLDGTRFAADNLKDARLTIFNVWGTTCAPCIHELPYLQKLNDTYAPGEIQVIGLLSDSVAVDGVPIEQHLKDAKGYMDKSEATYPTLILDKETYAFVKTNIVGTPTTFFVNSDGEVVRTITGGNSYEDWKSYTDEELAKLS